MWCLRACMSFDKEWFQERPLQSRIVTAHLQWGGHRLTPESKVLQHCAEEHRAAHPWGQTALLHPDCLCLPRQTAAQMIGRHVLSVREQQKGVILKTTGGKGINRTYVKSTVEQRLEGDGSRQSSDTQVDLPEVHTLILHKEDSSLFGPTELNLLSQLWSRLRFVI